MSSKANKGSIKLTVMFDGTFWVGVFERHNTEGYSVAKHIFGDEPKSVDVHNFVLKHMDTLRFTIPQEEQPIAFKKKTPKRLQRDVKKELNKMGQRTISKAHEAMRIEIEKNKIEWKRQTKAEREEEAERKFLIKQEKGKQKHKGH